MTAKNEGTAAMEPTTTKTKARARRKVKPGEGRSVAKRKQASGPNMPKKLKQLASRLVKFDGELAQAWLDSDKAVREKTGRQNRPLSPANVKSKVSDMMAGCFMTTSQGPTIDSDGALLDGQHTLNAIVRYFDEDENAEPITLYVTEGENPENFPFYDQGKTRSTADVFGIEDVKYPREMAHATRLLWLRVNGKRVAGGGKVSPYRLAEFSKQHKGLAKSLDFIMSFGGETDTLPCKETMSPGYAAALHYLMTKAEGVTDSAIVDKFWTEVIDHGGDKGSASYQLYRLIIRVRNNKDMKMSRDALVDYCITAFNNYFDKNTAKLKLEDGFRPTLGGIDQSNKEVIEEEDLDEESGE